MPFSFVVKRWNTIHMFGCRGSFFACTKRVSYRKPIADLCMGLYLHLRVGESVVVSPGGTVHVTFRSVPRYAGGTLLKLETYGIARRRPPVAFALAQLCSWARRAMVSIVIALVDLADLDLLRRW